MTALEEATRLDREDRLVEAAEMYERVLANERASRETYLDLAVLYFVLLDPGEASARGVSDEFRGRASRRSLQLLREADDRFGPSSEVEFWRRYIQYSAFGGDSFESECKELADAEESLVPFFYLFAESGGSDFQNEANRLLQQVDIGATARQRYVKSILKSPAIALSQRVLAAARHQEQSQSGAAERAAAEYAEIGDKMRALPSGSGFPGDPPANREANALVGNTEPLGKGEFALPLKTRIALKAVFGIGADLVTIKRSPAFVRAHLAFIGGWEGSVTRPGTIYTTLTRGQFNAAHFHLLHEHFHVISQWGGGMTRLGYLMNSGAVESAANAFARSNLGAFRSALGAIQ